jgi:hypothetical protein
MVLVTLLLRRGTEPFRETPDHPLPAETGDEEEAA